MIDKSKIKIAIFGGGKIGRLVNFQLTELGFSPFIFDKVQPTFGCSYIPVEIGEQDIRIKDFSILINCLPFQYAKKLAKIAAINNMHYFDFTEDVATRKYIIELSEEYKDLIFMPHCGLAPGLISIIGKELIKNYDEISFLKVRVGALPIAPTNICKYYTSWSVEGLVNQYLQPCEILENKKLTKINSLEKYENINVYGLELEAFTTSGGLGTLAETYEGKIDNLYYQSLRYPGHYNCLKFLLEDLNLKNNPQEFFYMLNKLPKTDTDQVIINAEVLGKIGNVTNHRSVNHIVKSSDKWSAIQKATAFSQTALLELFVKDQLPKSGFIKQEDISWKDFSNTNSFRLIFEQTSANIF